MGAAGGQRRFIALVVAVVVCAAVLVIVASIRVSEVPTAAGAAAGSGLSTPSSSASASAGPVVSVISDEWGEAVGDLSWISALRDRLGVVMQAQVVPGAGYTEQGTSSDAGTFRQQSKRVRTDAKIIVLFGGRHDIASSPELAGVELSRTLSELASQAPNATVVVVGPVPPQSGTGKSFLDVRDALKAACALADVRWVDPVTRGWFSAGSGQYSGTTDLPSAAGEGELENEMVDVIRPLIN